MAVCKPGCRGEATERAQERGGCGLNGGVPSEVGGGGQSLDVCDSGAEGTS